MTPRDILIAGELKKRAYDKSYLFGLLRDYLYEPVMAQQHQALKRIIERNNQLLNRTSNFVQFRGEMYTVSPLIKPPRMIQRLDPRLESDMLEYLHERADIDNTEKPFVMGFVNQVLNSSDHPQDYLRLLPASVHRPVLEYIQGHVIQDTWLRDDQVNALLAQNAHAIQLMKNRMVLNLLI